MDTKHLGLVIELEVFLFKKKNFRAYFERGAIIFSEKI